MGKSEIFLLLLNRSSYSSTCYISSPICCNRKSKLYQLTIKAYVPINTITCPISFQERSNRPLQTQSLNACYSFRETLEIGVSFPIYIIAFMSFISWFLFVLFGGIGLAAVPLDLFYDFCTRPKRLKAHEIENYKKKVLRESESLKQLGNEIKELEEKGIKTKYCKLNPNNFLVFNAEKRNYDRLKNQFSAGIVIVEKEYQIIVINNEIGENAKWVILYWLLIPLGIISICLTLAWVAQM